MSLPSGWKRVPDANLELFFDEILASPSTEALLLGIYEKAVPAVIRAMERHQKETNPLVDAPSVRLCRFALIELNDMLKFGRRSGSAG